MRMTIEATGKEKKEGLSALDVAKLLVLVTPDMKVSYRMGFRGQVIAMIIEAKR
ncbi:hypothetical protein [Catellatospora sichuanensis]|uniref:hypothetical protein n=1 Tax=Catellatospora sichuanensis TaxID=1969805 RepID=UPI0016426B86|nr:hypothetical protein [Catellatospora sichuanensis]